MSAVGIVLGGGGVTGAAYELGVLMAVELATGWNPNQAEVVVGTSAGAWVASLLRNDRLDLASLVLPTDDRAAVARRIRERLFTRRPGVKVGAWLRHGILPGVRNPGLTLLLGCPAPYDTSGLRNWVAEELGPAAEEWPGRPTLIVAYDVAAKHRTAFGTLEAPEVALADAVAASTAIPLVFRPWRIGGRSYVDGGVVSGTHADLVLGSPRALDLVLIIAPMAAKEDRPGAFMPERLLDRVGCRSLDEEIRLIREAWPQAEILTLRPSPAVLASMRPNPLDPDLAVPAFIRTMLVMRRTLAQSNNWTLLRRHLAGTRSVSLP